LPASSIRRASFLYADSHVTVGIIFIRSELHPAVEYLLVHTGVEMVGVDGLDGQRGMVHMVLHRQRIHSGMQRVGDAGVAQG